MVIRALISGYGQKYYKYISVPIKNFNQVTDENIKDELLFHEKLIDYSKF